MNRRAFIFIMKPYLIQARTAHTRGIVRFLKNGTACVRMGKKEFRVPTGQQYDLTQATLFGLNERLTLSATSPVITKGGKTLRDEFNREWEAYAKALETGHGRALQYGMYAYYAGRNHLVRFSPPFWHRVVAVASSSKLMADPEDRLSWKEIRDIFEKTTIAVAGGSVGNNILHSIVMDLRPANVKIADKSLYKMENINRVRLSYWDIVEPGGGLRNKAIVTAEQLYAIDPYLNVHTYPEGISSVNIERFLGGGRGEPPADILLEEVDDPKIKIYLREEARKRRIPLLMLTDAGSSVQLDVLRYDKNPKLGLTYGESDEHVRESVRALEDDPGNRATFFSFVDRLIGTEYRRDELAKIIDEKTEIPTSTMIPQLGSTAAMAGAIAAETVARIRLGYDYPPRVLINKKTFEVRIFSV